MPECPERQWPNGQKPTSLIGSVRSHGESVGVIHDAVLWRGWRTVTADRATKNPSFDAVLLSGSIG